MRVLILGAAGMIGRRLAEKLARDGVPGCAPISALLLADVVQPVSPPGLSAEVRAMDIMSPQAVDDLIAWRPDLIFHLAAIVSGAAEADFTLGYDINVRATWSLLEALRLAGNPVRLVFSSSVAVFGAPVPDVVPDDFHLTPRSSYGAQKAMCELLVSDYSRKGFVDGVSLRLPTIVVRPGAPNAAASGFLSGILREPLRGLPANLPVDPATEVWIASPGVAVDSLLHAAGLPAGAMEAARVINGRGLTVSVADMIASLRAVAGDAAADLITHVPDPHIAAIVGSWPRAFACDRARALGFPVDSGIDGILRAHMAEELCERFRLP